MTKYVLTSTYTVTVERVHDTSYGVDIETAMDTALRRTHIGTEPSVPTTHQRAVCTNVRAELVNEEKTA